MTRDCKVANYDGRPIAVLGANTLFAVIRQQGRPQVLVGNDTSGEGAMFIEQALADGTLQVVQQLESQTPVDLCRVHKENLCYDARGSDSEKLSLFIAKVLANKHDNLRVCYSGHNDTVPTVIATTEYDNYDHLDVGNVVSFRAYSDAVEVVLNNREVQRALPATTQARHTASDQLAQELARIRQTYIQRFLQQEIDVLFVSIFRVEDNVLSYGGIRIVVKNKLQEVLTELSDRVTRAGSNAQSANSRQRAFEFEHLLPTIVKTAGDVEVDGVTLRYLLQDNKSETAELHYLNGRKIARDDLDEVINRVTCYRNQPELYAQFLQQVSTVSLKFHRSCARGIPIGNQAVAGIIKDAFFAADAASAGGHALPNDFGEYNTDIATAAVTLPFRKLNAATCGEVFILSCWRKVENFDLLLEACSGCIPRQYKHKVSINNARAHDGRANAELSVLRLLFYIDRALTEACRVTFPYLEPANSYRSARGLNATGAAIALGKKFLEQFKIDMSKRQEALERSRELFLRIVEQEKVQSEGEPPNERWLVTGKSGRRYRVGRDGKVTNLDDGGHVCIVNGGGRDLSGWDYLSSLVAALASDTMVAASVSTLGLKQP
jgi:uncharacterized protein YlzI (FlbEa/FlbD family)